VEERLEALQEAWNSFIIEFPGYPKVAIHGREENQRVLFLCPVQEANPTELCLGLFPSRILIHRLEKGEVSAALPRARLVFLYGSEIPVDLGPVLDRVLYHLDAPVLVARKSNVRRAAQCIQDFLARPLGPADAPPEWAEENRTKDPPAARAGSATELAGEIWHGVLPEISLINGDGRLQKAATDLQDYRAEYACRYVLAHYQENINRDKMAETVNLSPGYFSNLFRAEVGMSFSDYLIQVRIENAKRLLRRFDLSVEAISKQCGFNSLAHFSRTFKDRCGLSPLKYRKSPNSVT